MCQLWINNMIIWVIFHPGKAQKAQGRCIYPKVSGLQNSYLNAVGWNNICHQAWLHFINLCMRLIRLTVQTMWGNHTAICGEPAISHNSHHVSLVQWTNLFASHHKGHRFISPGGTYVEPGFSWWRFLATNTSLHLPKLCTHTKVIRFLHDTSHTDGTIFL
jgi:hypothetical protein